MGKCLCFNEEPLCGDQCAEQFDNDAKETTMQQDWECTLPLIHEDLTGEDRPSAQFITAISEFLDTDPQDLLLEHGYYSHAGLAQETVHA